MIRIGTSSWADPEFVRDWYPPKLPTAARQGWYAENFNYVEVNSSFYAIPIQKVLRRFRRGSTNSRNSTNSSHYFADRLAIELRNRNWLATPNREASVTFFRNTHLQLVDAPESEYFIKNWNGANSFILYGKGGEIASNDPEDQELTMLALHLLQIRQTSFTTQTPFSPGLRQEPARSPPRKCGRLVATENEVFRMIRALLSSRIHVTGTESLCIEHGEGNPPFAHEVTATGNSSPPAAYDR